MKYGFLILALTARALADADKGEQVEVKTVGVQPGTTILHTGALTQVHTVPAGDNEPAQSPRVITSPLSKQVFSSTHESERTITPSKQGGHQPAPQKDTTSTSAPVDQGSTMSTKAAAPQKEPSLSSKKQSSSSSQKPEGGGEQPQSTTQEPQGSQETPEPGSSPEGESSSKTMAQGSSTGGSSPQQETEAPSPSEGGGDGDGDGFGPYDGLHNGTDPLSSFDTGPEPTGPAVAAPIFPVVGDEDAEEVQVPQTLREAAKSNANKNNRVKNDTPFRNPLDGHLPVLNAGKSAPEKVPANILVKVGKHQNGTDTEPQSNSSQSEAKTQTSASQTAAPNNNFQASQSAATEPTPSTLIDTTSMSLKLNDQKKHTSTSAAASAPSASSAASTPAVSQQSAAPSQ